jgi:predicted DNA-binding transcriptional regulator AlpA
VSTLASSAELERLMGADRLQRPTRKSSNWDAWYEEFTATDRKRLACFTGGAVSPDELATWLDCSIDDALRMWKSACLVALDSGKSDVVDATEGEHAAAAELLESIVGPQEVADMLGVKVETVWQWRKRDILPMPARVISKVPLWSAAAINSWAEETGRLTLEEIPSF